MFDSRNDTLTDVTLFTLNNDMHIRKRSDVEFINFLEPGYGWVMQNVEERIFKKNKNTPQIVQHVALPLTLNKLPKDFYSVDPEPDTMSYSELRKFMQEQSANGLPVNHLLADYHEKFSFPFVTTIITLIVINFSILPARSGSMAAPIILSLGFSFSYYAIHSFCVALGRAEVVNPMLAAWLANTIYGMLALILISSIENQN
jgi:lipopolysaccharide export system permease protein